MHRQRRAQNAQQRAFAAAGFARHECSWTPIERGTEIRVRDQAENCRRRAWLTPSPQRRQLALQLLRYTGMARQARSRRRRRGSPNLVALALACRIPLIAEID